MIRCILSSNSTGGELKMLPSLHRAEILGIEEFNECDVYDITVENQHNFFAEHINVHNSADPRMCWGRKIRLTAGRI